MSCAGSKAITSPPESVSSFVSLILATQRSAVSGATVSGSKPEKPSMTALSVPCPRPVHASEPYKIAFTRFKRARSSLLNAAMKAAAAFIGPTVCEDDGPIPILNRSKTLIMQQDRTWRRLLLLEPRDDFAWDRLDLVHLVLVRNEDDFLHADGEVRFQLLDALIDRAHDCAFARAITVL